MWGNFDGARDIVASEVLTSTLQRYRVALDEPAAQQPPSLPGHRVQPPLVNACVLLKVRDETCKHLGCAASGFSHPSTRSTSKLCLFLQERPLQACSLLACVVTNFCKESQARFVSPSGQLACRHATDGGLAQNKLHCLWLLLVYLVM